MAEIPRDRRVAVHCAGGYRSSIAASILHQYGIIASFSMIGRNAAAFPGVARQVAAAGQPGPVERCPLVVVSRDLVARQAEVALRALDNADALTDGDRDFYTGKLAVARFFATTVLPRLESDRKIIEQTTTDLMEIPEGAF